MSIDYKERLKDGFSPMAKKYDKILSLITLGRIHKWQSEMLSMIDNKGVLLDLGTGTGGVPILGKQFGFEKIIGIDYVYNMLEIAKGKEKDIFYINGDISELPVKDNSIDAITISLTFRYLADPDKFLREAVRVLNNKGRMVILDVFKSERKSIVASVITYIIKSVIHLIKIFKHRKEYPLRGLEKKYKIDEIKDLLERYNFSLIDMKRYSLGMIGIISAEIKT